MNERLEGVETYSKIKVYENHNSKEFKEMCQNFKKDVEEYHEKIKEVDIGYEEDDKYCRKEIKMIE